MIDIIIPVYKGFSSTRRCIASVLANPQRTPFHLVVIDDAGPEPEIASYLEALADE